MRRLTPFVALAVGLVTGIALLTSAPGTAVSSRSGPAACAARWRVVVSALTVPSLSAVAVVSSRDVWVVGPDDVAAVAANDVWAVGTGAVSGSRSLVMHFDGRRWRVVDLAGVAPHASGLSSVDAASACDVWAAGAKTPPGESYGSSDLVLHWDGTSWRPQPTPFDTLKHRYLNAVSAVSPKEIWAVGNHLIVRYSC